MRHPGSSFALFLIFMGLGVPAVAASPAANTEALEEDAAAQPGNASLLVKGAELPSTNGIMFNGEDELFVTSVVGRSITQVDPNNGGILARLGPEQGVEAPDDLIFDASGNLYWTAFLTGEVGRLTPEGNKTTVANLGRGVNAITISDDGDKLYVSRVFLADEVWELDLAGNTPPRLIARDLGGFNGMDIGPDGKLYGPLWYRGQVARIDPASGAIEIVAEGLATPAAVKFNHVGELFVIDQAQGEVLQVNIDERTLVPVAEVGEGADNLAFDSQNRLYVTNAHESAIRRVFLGEQEEAEESLITHLYRNMGWDRIRNWWQSSEDKSGVRMLTKGGLTTTGGVALHEVNGRTSLFVADIYSIREYAPHNGRLRNVSHSIVGGITPLNTPFSVSSHGSHLLVTSWFANSVQVWDPELQDMVDVHGDFDVPLNAIGLGEDLVVAELGSGCVMHRPTSTVERLPLACGFTVPVGLAEHDGKVWVSDWATGSVWQITENYKAMETPVQVARGLMQPEGLAATESGTLLIVETGADRLVDVDLATGVQTTVVDELPLGNSATPGYPPSWIFNGVTVDECGVVYLNVDSDRSIRRIADKKAVRCEVDKSE